MEPSITPPKQQRSRDTLARIVNATERLLEDRSFEDVSVAEIVKRSRSSIGAFYARFDDKDALLAYLDNLHAEDLIEQVTGYCNDDCWQAAPVEELVSELIRFLIEFFREHKGLLCALSIRARLRDDARFAEPTRRVNSRVPELIRLVLSRRSEIGHPSPEHAVYLGFVMILSTIRERVLFPEVYPTQLRISDALFAEELKQAYLAYLGV